MYLGSVAEETYMSPVFDTDTFEIREETFVPALVKAYNEVVDNCQDILNKTRQRIKRVDITVDPKTQEITVADNGPGIPLDIRPSGKYRPEVALTKLKAGSNFNDDTKAVGTIGMNGIGVSATNACAKSMTVDVWRDKKHYHQKFADGSMTIFPPKIKAYTGSGTGTQVSFIPDKTIFNHSELPVTILKNRAYELALCNPDIAVTFNGDRIRYKKGFAELASQISDNSFEFTMTKEDGTSIQIIVMPAYHDLKDEIVFCWVNSSLLYGGGLANTQITNAFIGKVLEYLEPQAKRAKIQLHKDDVRSGLFIIANIKVANPKYDSQAKTRMTGPNMRDEFKAIFEDNWTAFSRKNKQWLADVFQNAQDRYHKSATKAALKDHKRHRRVEGLIDANTTNRSEAVLFCCEGLSAQASGIQVRQPNYHAFFPLTGKINNVYDATIAEVLKMDKVADLLAVIGLTPGVKADPANMRYGKIVFATDADIDGSHIVTLLTNLFYKFWPELFDPDNPMIARLMAPNVEAIKGKKRVPFVTLEDFKKVADQYKGYEIHYNKGLGSMQISSWDFMLSRLDEHLLYIVDDGNMDEVLKLHFSTDVAARKQWLTGADND